LNDQERKEVANRIKEILARIIQTLLSCASQSKSKLQKKRTLHHRSTTEAEANQAQIYQALDVSSQIFKVKKYFSTSVFAVTTHQTSITFL